MHYCSDPLLKRELVVERENLLGKLSEYMGRERKGFRNVGPARKIHGIPDTVNNVYFVRQLQAKVEDIMKTGEQLLSDLSSWPSLKAEAGEFVEEMGEYQREQFDGWTRDNLEDIKGGVSLQTSSQVVYFEAGKDMKVSTQRQGKTDTICLHHCFR